MRRMPLHDSALWITKSLCTYHKGTSNKPQRSNRIIRHKMNKARNLLWDGISELCIFDKNNVKINNQLHPLKLRIFTLCPNLIIKLYVFCTIFLSFSMSLEQRVDWLFISCTASFKVHFQNTNSTQLLFYFNESRFGFYFVSDATSPLPQAMFKLIGINSIRTSLTTPRGTVQRGGHSAFTSTIQTGRRCWLPIPPSSFQFRLLGFHSSFVTLFI